MLPQTGTMKSVEIGNARGMSFKIRRAYKGRKNNDLELMMVNQRKAVSNPLGYQV